VVLEERVLAAESPVWRALGDIVTGGAPGLSTFISVAQCPADTQLLS
jgi:hypothetical protein